MWLIPQCVLPAHIGNTGQYWDAAGPSSKGGDWHGQLQGGQGVWEDDDLCLCPVAPALIAAS